MHAHYRQHSVTMGRLAFGIEQHIMNWLQDSGYDRGYLAKDDTQGNTETFSREAGAETAFRKIAEFAKAFELGDIANP